MPRKTQKKTKVSISCTPLQHTWKEPPRKVTGLLTCIYTNTRSMDKKLEELEVVVQQENYCIAPSSAHGGTACMAGARHWEATNSSEGTG